MFISFSQNSKLAKAFPFGGETKMGDEPNFTTMAGVRLLYQVLLI